MLDTGKIKVSFEGDTSGLERAISKSQGKLKQFGNKMAGIGKTMTKFVTLPILGMGAAMIKSASDAAETHSKFQTVFRGVGDEATKMAKVLQQSYIMSGEQSERLLSNTGDLLTGFGFTKDAALDLSFSVQKLAADLASFNNVDVTQSSEALTKALLGERESLKSLGIAIRESDVKQRLLEKGQQNLTGQALLAAKAQATFELAMQQSGNALGDVGRTSGSFANQMKLLRARIHDLSVSIGSLLLPIANKLLKFVLDAVKWFNGLSKTGKKIIVIVAGIAAAIGPIVFIFGKIITVVGKVISIGGKLVGVLRAVGTAIGAATWEVVAIIAIIVALGVAIKGIIDGWDYVEGATLVAWKAIKNAFAQAIDWITQKFKGFMDFFGGADWVDEAAKDTHKWAIETQKDLDKTEKEVGSFSDNMSKLGGKIVDAYVDVYDSVTSLGDAFESTGNKGVNSLSKVDKKLKELKSNTIKKSQFMVEPMKMKVDKVEPVKVPVKLEDFDSKKISETMSEVNKQVASQILTAKALGESYDANAIKLNEYTSAYQYLIAQGVSPSSSAMQTLSTMIGELNIKVMEAADPINNLTNYFQDLGDLTVDVFSQIGTALGRSIQDHKKYKDAVKDSMKQSLLATLDYIKVKVIAMAVDAAAPAGPFAMAIVGGLIAGALSLINGLIAGALSSGTSSFATGGMVTGPTLAMVGDNPSGKEAIIPFERMGEFINQFSSDKSETKVIVLDSTIRGDDILLTADRSKEKRNMLF